MTNDHTKIQWTDATWNVVTGCSKVSDGCKHCYAERDWSRVYGASAPAQMRAKYGVRKFTDVMCHDDRLDQPIRWQKPRRIFVNSMSDLFHENVPAEFIAKVFETMRNAPQHIFQILTKRPERMREILSGIDPLPNVWLGISAENQETANERIPILLDTPAAVKFVSAEPLLGPIDFSRPLLLNKHGDYFGGSLTHPSETGLDWVIVGGESGPKARPCDVAWIRSIVEQCKAAGVSVFVKQLGARPCQRKSQARGYEGVWVTLGPGEQRIVMDLKDRKGGDMTEWPEDLRVREIPGG